MSRCTARVRWSRVRCRACLLLASSADHQEKCAACVPRGWLLAPKKVQFSCGNRACRRDSRRTAVGVVIALATALRGRVGTGITNQVLRPDEVEARSRLAPLELLTLRQPLHTSCGPVKCTHVTPTWELWHQAHSLPRVLQCVLH